MVQWRALLCFKMKLTPGHKRGAAMWHAPMEKFPSYLFIGLIIILQQAKLGTVILQPRTDLVSSHVFRLYPVS